MPTDVLNNLNLRPFGPDHQSQFGRQAVFRARDTYFESEELNRAYAQCMGTMQQYYDDNTAAYLNRRRQLRQRDTDLKIISRVGYNELLRADIATPLFAGSIGLSRLENPPAPEAGVPVFKYFPPRDSGPDNLFKRIPAFQRPNIVVMHCFGLGLDRAQLDRSNARCIPIDPRTGHNPHRWMNGVRTLISPAERNTQTSIHHAVSLRGDLINSVSWDNSCTHGGGDMGAGLRVNARSIGIEHEAWYVKRPGINIDQIIDQGPFSEEQMLISAFILKKFQAWTGLDYCNFLGHGQTCRDNVRNGVNGCINHSDIGSQKRDPGAEFWLMPDFEVGVTNTRTHVSTQANWSKWNQRISIWYSGLPQGTKVSAYARIFEKVQKLRHFDITTEVFDTSLHSGPVTLIPPQVTGSGMTAAVQGAVRGHVNAVDRAQQMQGQTRVAMYGTAEASTTASRGVWERAAANVARVINNMAGVPLMENALAFNFETGLWVNRTTPTVSTVSETSEIEQPVIDPTDRSASG